MVKEVRYITLIGKGVNYYEQHFKDEVAAYLADPDGWVSQGYRFIYTSKHPDIFIELCHPNVLATNGCEDADLSCAEMGGRHMYLNSERWVRNGSKSKLNLTNYRQYMVSHEMGHILGYDHAQCPGRDMPAPIMMQQTRGIGQCKPNTKLTQTDLKSKQ